MSDVEAPQGEKTSTSYRPALFLTWTVVSVPLAYGLFHAVKAVLQLFTG
ncbi:MFS transporter small subunit [Zhihengliuella halotolerans]|nr:hypothetical protein [Zhihengliuella halotolerans]